MEGYSKNLIYELDSNLLSLTVQYEQIHYFFFTIKAFYDVGLAHVFPDMLVVTQES